MDTVMLKFSQQLETAIDSVNTKINTGTLSKNQLEMAKKTREKLNNIRSSALAGILLRPSGGKVPANLQLGLTRFAQEWTDDKTILSQLNHIESYYSSNV